MAEKILKETGVFNPMEKLVCQCYDGAALMSGHVSGVQTRIREQIDRALFVHCMGHEVRTLKFEYDYKFDVSSRSITLYRVVV